MPVAGADHPAGHHDGEIGAIAIFQAVDERAGNAVMDGDGSQPLEHRRIGDGVGRQNAGTEIMGERHAENLAIGPLDQPQCRPAGRANATMLADHAAASAADRRIDGIDRRGHQTAQASGQPPLPDFPPLRPA